MTRQEMEKLIISCRSWQLDTMKHDDNTIEIKKLMPSWWDKEEKLEVDTILDTIIKSGQTTRDEEVGMTTVKLEDCVVWWWWN